MTTITYFDNSDIPHYEEVRDEDMEVHSYEDKPSVTEFNRDGSVYYQKWYNHGSLHRLLKPAFVLYYPSGKVRQQLWANNGVFSRGNVSLPYLIMYYSTGDVMSKRWVKTIDKLTYIKYYKTGVKMAELFQNNNFLREFLPTGEIKSAKYLTKKYHISEDENVSDSY